MCIRMLQLNRRIQMQKSPLRLVTKKELKTIYNVPYSFQHLARLEKDGKFPRRIRLGPCRVAYLAEDVEAWIISRFPLD